MAWWRYSKDDTGLHYWIGDAVFIFECVVTVTIERGLSRTSFSSLPTLLVPPCSQNLSSLADSDDELLFN